MRNPKILGLNTNFELLHFPNFHEDSFSSVISLLDYDAVIIDTSNLMFQYTDKEKYKNRYLVTEPDASQMKADFEHIQKQADEFLSAGHNIYLLVGHNENCYCRYERSAFDLLGDPTEFDMYSFLPVSLTLEHLKGKEIASCGNAPFNTFFEVNKGNLEYNATFEVQKGTVLAKIRKTDKVISFSQQYKKGTIIFLPTLDPDIMIETPRGKKFIETFLQSIYDIDNQLCLEKEVNTLPDWAEDFHILDEIKTIDAKRQAEQRIEKLKKALETEQKKLEHIINYKRLMTETGAPLENIVKQVLSELGFELCPTEEKRSDVIAKYGDIDIVAEIKGVGKSAAEKHAAQLEKWASQFLIDHGHQPRALLIVNGYNTLPLDQRIEEVFPDQMLKYSTSREQALITTTQLLCLFIEIQEHPECKEERIQELLSTIGRYNRYTDYSEFITQ
jgi:hypothetical protein